MTKAYRAQLQVGTIHDPEQPLAVQWDTTAWEDVDTTDATAVLADWLSNQPQDETPTPARVCIWADDEQGELLSEADTL